MGYCIASDPIAVDILNVVFMYFENPDYSLISGWRFFCGSIGDDCVNNPDNIGLYDLNKIVYYELEIIDFYVSPFQTAFV